MSENGLLPSKATGSLDSSSSSSPDGSPDFGLDLTVASERLDGGRTRLCDSLAAELAQQLELIVEDTPGLLATVNQDAKHTEESLPLELEIEGRLGVLIDLDTGTRLRLPLSSLTLLSSSFCTGAAGPGGGPPASAGLRFEAGVNQDQFASLQEFIMTMAVGKPPAGQSPSAGVHTLGGPGVAGQHLGEQKRGYDQGPSPPSGGSAPFASGAWQTAVQEEEEFFSDWASLIDESSSEDEGKSRSSKATRSKSRTGKGSPSHSPPSEQSPEVASWKPLAVESTEEEYHNLSCLTDTAIRLSYPHPKPTTGNLLPIAAVWKANQMTWNLYAGQDSQQEWTDDAARGGGGADDGMALGDDDNCRCRVDCRLAINLEHHASLRDVARDLERKTKAGGRYLMGQAQQGPNMRRIKKRQSFVHPCGVRIDLTEVRMDVGGGGKGPGGKGRQRILYEVETELNAALVLQAIQYKQLTGDSLPLLSLCVSFLTVLEDLSVHLNTVLMASPSASGSFSQSVASGIGGPSFSSDGTEGREPRFADLSRCFPPSASVALFKKYLSPCLPLVGDYAFRAVAPALARKGEEELKDYLSRINVDEESLYTNDTVTIVGPWVPCLNEEGRLEFAVPVARPSASVGDQSETMAKLLMS
uniref:mRNA 5'-phosphatase n=1 Tax=Neospora caninum (strain Liverpool) TaxID=572307 RepID=F0JB77_NEOCL|nr:hypothetical protein, conserved [Neospora caninum Liverpool]CEL71344.1 TPA: hypothetical protein, conserved [Neospora caninum Liverpool]